MICQHSYSEEYAESIILVLPAVYYCTFAKCRKRRRRLNLKKSGDGCTVVNDAEEHASLPPTTPPFCARIIIMSLRLRHVGILCMCAFPCFLLLLFASRMLVRCARYRLSLLPVSTEIPRFALRWETIDIVMRIAGTKL